MRALMTVTQALQALLTPDVRMCNLTWNSWDHIYSVDRQIYNDGGNIVDLSELPLQGWYDMSTQVAYLVRLGDVVLRTAPGLDNNELEQQAEERVRWSVVDTAHLVSEITPIRMRTPLEECYDSELLQENNCD